ncbi:MAG: histidine phosphatase family protein [Pseudomonadota bacterium]
MRLWLVRHAQPLIGKGICYGQLDMKADMQATQDCAQALAAVLPEKIIVAASPLQRCGQLALALSVIRPALAIKQDARLQEMHFGNWEDRSWSSLPKDELDAWTEDFAGYPAGQTGENVTQFMGRVAAAFDELPTGQDTLWITHAGVIRAAQLLANGVRRVDRATQWPGDAPSYGQWCTLDIQSSSGRA